MKTKLIIFNLLITIAVYSQEIKISDLELPDSPAFTILDFTPSSISTPSTPQAFTANLLNAINSTNFAIELSPYWVFGSENKTFNSYYEDENKKFVSKPFKNLSFSLATVTKDEVQNISFGLRTNLLRINSSEKINSITNLGAKLIAFNATLDGAISPAENPFQLGTPEANEWQLKKIDEMSKNPKYLKESSAIYDDNDAIGKIKPYFSVDVASAYSLLFVDDSYKNGKFGRFGAWTTLNQNISLSKDHKNYISFYQYGRFLIDETVFDSDTNEFKKDENFDLGVKVELQFNKLTFGYEYINRTNQSENYRSVGNIKYKINDQIILNGGFGKNFENTNNLVSFLGISWGITPNDTLESK